MGYRGHCIGRVIDVLESVFGFATPYDFIFDGKGNIIHYGKLIATYIFPNKYSDLPELKFYGDLADHYTKLWNQAINHGLVKNQLKLTLVDKWYVNYIGADGKITRFGLMNGFMSFETARSWLIFDSEIKNRAFFQMHGFIEKVVEEVYL